MRTDSRTARVLIGLVCCMGLTTLGETGTRWAQAIGGSKYDVASSIHPTADQGYIVGGYITRSDSTNHRAWMAKLDSSGTVVWERIYGGKEETSFAEVLPTEDGGYIAVGILPAKGKTSDAWVVRTSSTGAIIWQKSYGGTGSEWIYSLCPTPDGGWVASGGTTSSGDRDGDAWLFKIDSAGTLLWQRAYAITASDYEGFWSVRPTSDGGYVAAGQVQTVGTHDGVDGAWCVKTDSLGKVQWHRVLGREGYTQDFLSVIQARDGGYVLAGYTNAFGAGIEDAWVLKLSSSGSLMWQRTYGGSQRDHIYEVRQTVDGGYILAGRSASFGDDSYDAWLLKLRPSGKVWWSKVYGGEEFDEAHSLNVTEDGGFCVAGSSSSYGTWYYKDAILLRTAPDGKIDTSCGSLYRPVSPSSSLTPVTVSSPTLVVKKPAVSTGSPAYSTSKVSTPFTSICSSPTL